MRYYVSITAGLFLTCFLGRTQDWNQIGANIDGVAFGDLSGWTVSLDSTGAIVAIGDRDFDSNGQLQQNIGRVRIYQWNGTMWSQLGQDILGEVAGDHFGWSVSLSSDGSVIAVGSYANTGFAGHVRVYQFNGIDWDQVGSDIDGESTGDLSGWSVALNNKGDILAIGAPESATNGTRSGQVKVYQFDGNDWAQLGSNINGDGEYDDSGISVDLNGNGNTLAIGARGAVGSKAGYVKVYSYDGQDWIIDGSAIQGESQGDNSGWSVSLNNLGNIVAIGAYDNDNNFTNSGHVRVHQFDGSNWKQLGQDIDGQNDGDNSGWSVSLNDAGNIVAIGAVGFNGYSGRVSIHEFCNGDWDQLGTEIHAEGDGDKCGHSVALSASGDIVVAGAPNNDNLKGHLRVFHLSTLPNYVPDDGLIAWYPFNGSPNDESRNGYHGSNVGATLSTDRFGKMESAYSFSTDSYVTLPELPGIVGVNQSASFSIWFKGGGNPDASSVVGRILSIEKPGTNQWIIAIECPHDINNYPGDRRKVYFRCPTENNEPVSEQTFDRTQWHNITVVIDHVVSEYRYYFNGVLDESMSFTYDPSLSYETTDRRWTIGTTPLQSNTQFYGQIDDLGIWSRALSTEEITKIYESIEIGTTPEIKMEVEGGSILVDQIGEGLVLRSPDGDCWSLSIDNEGNLLTIKVDCPD